MTMDTYWRALRDPGFRAWAIRHFRFPRDNPEAAKTMPRQAEDGATEVQTMRP